MNFELVFIFITQEKFVTPFTILLFGGFIRSLQLPYAPSVYLIITRLIAMMVFGVIVSLVIEDENDLFMFLSSFLTGYFIIDLCDITFRKFIK